MNHEFPPFELSTNGGNSWFKPDIYWNGEMVYGATMVGKNIYDEIDPGASIVLDRDLLDTVYDQNTATQAIRTMANRLDYYEKQSATGVDLMTLFAEEAVFRAATVELSGDIVINQLTMLSLQDTAANTGQAAEQALNSAWMPPLARDLTIGVRFVTNSMESVTIRIEQTAVYASVDNVRVETPYYALTFSVDTIGALTAGGDLTIKITPLDTTGSQVASTSLTGTQGINTMEGVPGAGLTRLADPATYKIEFNRPIEDNVKISLPPAPGDTAFQAIMNSQGVAVGGKYNPVTGKLEARINTGDTYTVKENKLNFGDIAAKSNEMRNAINVLASKGIINGTTATTFNPDGTMSRAEIAMLITRTFSKYNANADGGFSDVTKSDWYFGAVGSAKKHGFMVGTNDTTFMPKQNIPKEQIVTLAARVLRLEMKYKLPTNVSGVLSAYPDSDKIPPWGRDEIALATRENLVIRRTDGSFNGTATMTRGDAAIVLYRMFMRIW